RRAGRDSAPGHVIGSQVGGDMESVREILEGKMDVILQLNHDLETVREIVRTLLQLVGERGFCPRCGERVVYLRYVRTSAILPHNCDGTAHRATCTKQFAREGNHE